MCKETNVDQLETSAASGDSINETECGAELVDSSSEAPWEDAWGVADFVGYPHHMWYPDVLGQIGNPYWSPFAWNPDSSWMSPEASMMFPSYLQTLVVAPPKRKKQQSKPNSTIACTVLAVPVDNGVGDEIIIETRTTIMVRNIPNDLTRDMLLKLLDGQGFEGKYNFAYLPVDFSRWAGLGYAFVNFLTGEDADRARRHFHGFTQWECRSAKVCEVSWSYPVQGLEENIKRYQNSPVMHDLVPDCVRPVIYSQGQRAEFPKPTKKIRPPRVKKHPGGMAMAARALQVPIDGMPFGCGEMLELPSDIDPDMPLVGEKEARFVD